MSLGYSIKKSQYGCDRCGTLLGKELSMIDESYYERRNMWFQAYNLRTTWFVSWLTLILLVIGIATIVIYMFIGKNTP